MLTEEVSAMIQTCSPLDKTRLRASLLAVSLSPGSNRKASSAWRLLAMKEGSSLLEIKINCNSEEELRRINHKQMEEGSSSHIKLGSLR